jgi:hypothetical protein
VNLPKWAILYGVVPLPPEPTPIVMSVLASGWILPPTAQLAIGLLIVSVAAIVAAKLCRRAGVAGAAVLGGLVAGVVLGPGVVGRIAPTTWVQTFVGPSDVLAAVTETMHERAALEFALATPSAAGANARDALAAIDERRSAADRAWDDARRDRQAPLHLLLACLAACVLLASGGASAVRAPVRRHQIAEALLHAAWWSVAGIAGAAAVQWLRGEPLLTVRSCVLAAASCCGPWCIGRDDRRLVQGAFRESGALLEHSGRIATTVAILLVGAAALIQPWTWHRALVAVPLVCLPLGWMVRVPVARVAERVALPSLTALLVLYVEPFSDIRPLLALALYVALEDARWLGGWLGLRLSGRAAAGPAARASFAALTVEPMIVAFVALGTLLGDMPPGLTLATLLAASAIAASANARRLVAQRMWGDAADMAAR